MQFKPLLNQQKYFASNGHKVAHKKGQSFVTYSDSSNWVYYLASGLVAVSYIFSSGQKRLLGFLRPGMTFGFADPEVGQDGGNIEYISLDTTESYRLPRSVFEEQVVKNQDFNKDYLDLLQYNQVFLIERIIFQGEKGVYARSIRWLLFMAKHYGKTKGKTCAIGVPLTQETAANFMHVTRESASTVLRELTRKGLITTRKKIITINNIELLTKELEIRTTMS